MPTKIYQLGGSGHGSDQGDPIYCIVSKDINGNTVSNPIFIQISADGIHALGSAYPLPISGNASPNSAVNVVYVTDSAVRPGENATLSCVDIRAILNGTYSPPKTATGSFTVLTEILPPFEVLPYKSFNVTVKNTGANALTSCLLFTSPDNTSWDDGTVMNATLTTLGAGKLASQPYTLTGYHYIKVKATAGVATTTDAWLNTQV